LTFLEKLLAKEALNLTPKATSQVSNPYQALLANYKDISIAPKEHVKPVSPGNTIKFALVGDINLSRNVNRRIRDHEMDYTFPLQKIKPFLEGIDIKYGNLESAITESQKTKKVVRDCKKSKSKCCGTRCHFKTSPKVLDGIVEYTGFNVLSIENNHIDDWEGGREDTQHVLDQFDVAWIDSSHPYKIKDFKGCDIDFFAYDITYTSNVLYEFKKTAMMAVLRTAAKHAFKVVCVHGGQEYKTYYDKQQQAFAETAIDNGADMVVMSHAHVTQPYVLYKDKYIFYGMGNFVFDQKFSLRVREFLMATFELEDCKNVVNMEVWNGLLNRQFQPEIISLNMTTRETKKSLLPTAQAGNGFLGGH